MKVCVLFICSLLLVSSQSRSLQQENANYLSAQNELNAAEEFLESTLEKIKNIDITENETNQLKQLIEYFIGFVLELIKKEPFKEVEIEKGLSEILELIHQASEMENNGNEMNEVLNKLETAEETIIQFKNNQQDAVVKYIVRVVEIVNGLKAKVEADPDNILESLRDSPKVVQSVAGAPVFLSKLLKKSFLEIIEQLWSADIAVESIKASNPSEAEQLKEILRKIEDKMNTLRIGTKKCTLGMALQLMVSILPNERLIRELTESQSKPTDVISLGGPHTISEDDPELEEMKTKMIEMGEILEGADPQILAHIEEAIELIKAHFPDENQLEGLVDEMKIKTSELKESIKTVVDKIKLDAAKGLKTNCLYVEIFAHVLKETFIVFQRNLNEFGNIIPSLIAEFPDGDVKSSLEEAIEKLGALMNDTTNSFSKFLKMSMEVFSKFRIGSTQLSSVPDETDCLATFGDFQMNS